ncbi:protein O-mannosyl-transferase family [Neptunicella sp. SCSIO 80796]|uniref:protein O-mannosyl-transferase family n=1 Tax=Neptunicella plasticusilytica TaxID=3117012 RepID=UPI003A4D2BA4
MNKSLTQRYHHTLNNILAGDKLANLIVFVLFTAFYLLTMAGNLSETDDVYAFAYRTEQFSFSHVSDPRLMLFHMLSKVVYIAINALSGLLDMTVSALFSMRLFSACCAAISLLLLLRILYRDFKLSPQAAVLGSLLLAFSYGFWRYAAEAEVYIAATALCLLIFHLMLTPRWQSLKYQLLVGVLAGLSILFYQPDAIPLLFAFPLLTLGGGQIIAVGGYYCAAGCTLLAGYLWGFWLFWPEPLSLDSFIQFLSQRSEEFMVPAMSFMTVIVSMLRALFALSHDTVSTNWIFSFHAVQQFIHWLFPQNVITEEIFLAKSIGPWRYLFAVSHILLIGIILFLLASRLPKVRFSQISRQVWVVVIWVLINGAIIGRLNPAGTEAWIMLLAPLTILVSLWIIQPLLDTHKKTLVLLVSLLFAHNLLAGMLLVHNPGEEYHRIKGKWVIEHATADDLVIVSGDAGFAEALRYLSPAKILYIGKNETGELLSALMDNQLNNLSLLSRGRDFNGQSIAANMQQHWQHNGRVMVFDELFNSGDPMLNLKIQQFSQKIPAIYQPAQMSATYLLQAPAK